MRVLFIRLLYKIWTRVIHESSIHNNVIKFKNDTMRTDKMKEYNTILRRTIDNSLLFFAFPFGNCSCTGLCGTHFPQQIRETCVVQVQYQSQQQRRGNDHVQKIVLEPIEIVGSRAEVRRSFVPYDELDPKDGFVHDRRGIVSHYRRRPRDRFAEPVTILFNVPVYFLSDQPGPENTVAAIAEQARAIRIGRLFFFFFEGRTRIMYRLIEHCLYTYELKSRRS